MTGLAWMLLLVPLALLCPPAARAQVETDGSLGPAMAVPPGTLPDGTLANFRIDESLGQRRGSNLFHSFRFFGVPPSTTAGFTADLPTERIVARVTGGDPSTIQGRLVNAAPGADLYLMNPMGVVFTTNASLDVRGSVFVSTANSLRFADDAVFPAALAAPVALSAAAPAAWGFTGETFGFARFTLGRRLAVPAGETFSATGGSVLARGTSAPGVLAAPGGEVHVAARLGAGEVPLDLASLDARAAAEGELGLVQIGPSFSLDARDPALLASERGRVVIRAGRLVLDQGGAFAGSSLEPDGARPDIDIETRDSIELVARSAIEATGSGQARGGTLRLSSGSVSIRGGSRALVGSFDSASAGALELSADSLALDGGSQLTSFALGDATAGAIHIAADRVDVREGGTIASTNSSSQEARELEIQAGELVLQQNGQIASDTSGAGRGASLQLVVDRLAQSSGGLISTNTSSDAAGGEIGVEAGEVSLLGDAASFGPGGVFASAFGNGSAGDIRFDVGTLAVEGGAQISATAQSAGAGGNIDVAAARSVVLRGSSVTGPSGIFARSGEGPGSSATGAGGDIFIASGTISVEDGAEISTTAFGDGDAGSVRLAATESVTVSGSGDLRSSINARVSRGSGGDVDVAAPDVSVLNGGEITVSTNDSGDAGNVHLDAERVSVGGGAETVDPAGIFAQSNDQLNTVDAGNAGDIEIRASRRLELRDGALISASTRGAGEAGSVVILGTKQVSVHDGEISARSDASGRAGAVRLDGVGTLSVGGRGRITTLTRETAPGGHIDIHVSREAVVADGGEISARSLGTGDAGSIDLFAGQQLTLRNGGRITTEASSAFGGNISLGARHLLYLKDGEITTSVDQGAGNGGNISIDPEFVVLNGGRIAANANAGNGGNILIRTDHFVLDAGSTVEASSELGIDGEIEITSPEADLTGELAELDADYLDASSQLARACAARSAQRGTFSARAAVGPSAPDAPLDAREPESAAPEGCGEPKQP